MQEEIEKRKEGSIHRPVLLNETIEGLKLQDKAVVLDATFGGGGHSLEIFKKFPKTKILAIDQDGDTWQRVKEKFSKFDISFEKKNFREIEGTENFDGIIFDLGLSSDQLENSGRGFSFMKDEPLLMTMKENILPEDLTAKDIVNDWSQESIEKIIRGYGEEKFSKRIASKILAEREKKEIKTTQDLVQILKKALPVFYQKGKIHFATKTFQALRIAVNDELRVLATGLENGFKALKTGGRMTVISFHSLEDRIVKKFFLEKKIKNEAKLINKKPITAQKEEIKNNNRSRSAKLRILEKL